ncbi:fumarylacetoacetate hydrolase family protein [Rhodobacter sp. NTK016B]|uniref:2-keto-4-pentenoate hydratase n=1 Tax=Rhodobacter sp. NTK016B TaxID=2759676 RepID=UPI001A8D1FDC|nr:fumarylacetoacetate hydrolase family protein [Rhodobacter sp. NTK016B]MBN8292042.1 fumarylacetoacetate hydrolase family protein [Rhodobacter sp. NTK016B]
MITIADAILHALDHRQPMAPITDSDPDFDLPRAYAAQAELTKTRLRRGARVVGMKTGFTNTTIWDAYNVHAPIHGPVFDTTWRQGPIAAADFVEPRIEPEIVLRLSAAPAPDMDDSQLAACVDGVARGFEIVDSPFPGWRFRAADTVAAGALHGALVTGDFVPATPDVLAALAQINIRLIRDDQVVAQGRGANVLGTGPLAALRYLVAQLGDDRLAPGWIVSTGTLTDALPVAGGETWTTRIDGINLPPLTLRVT